MLNKYRTKRAVKAFYDAERSSTITAAENGDANAQKSMGTRYMLGAEFGRGVKRDLVKAKELLSLSVSQGNAKAMNNLGGLYLSMGDFDKAEKLIDDAEQNGFERIDINKGMLHLQRKEYSEAVDFFIKAAKKGHYINKALGNLSNVYNTLYPQFIRGMSNDDNLDVSLSENAEIRGRIEKFFVECKDNSTLASPLPVKFKRMHSVRHG